LRRPFDPNSLPSRFDAFQRPGSDNRGNDHTYSQTDTEKQKTARIFIRIRIHGIGTVLKIPFQVNEVNESRRWFCGSL
jgi:hypothetical protein